MKNVKYINCFGTSFTAGGGFEFEGNFQSRREILKKIYGNLNEELTQANFSYPGQLQKLLTDIQVTNFGKNGYGNDRMYRLAYDIISRKDFKKEEHIFLFEFAGLGRKEYWFNEINDYVILNYRIASDNRTLKDGVDLANSWFYDTMALKAKLKNEEPFFLELYNKTFNIEHEFQLYYREIDFFLSYLNSKNINYFLLTSIPSDLSQIDDITLNKCFTFGDGKYFKYHTDFIKFTNLNRLEIDMETRRKYIDNHNGYVSNKIVGETIFNSLIDMNFLDLEKVNIDYQRLKNIKFEISEKN
jgi:hypothetical protein